MCRYLNISTKILISSEQFFDYSNVGNAGEWALRIAEQMAASEYINPVAGKDLFSEDKFSSCKIKLSFLKSHDIVYFQSNTFVPSLSIIDVLMFNGIHGTIELLNKHSIECIN